MIRVAKNAIHRLGSIRHEPVLSLEDVIPTDNWVNTQITASFISVGVLISLIIVATYLFGVSKQSLNRSISKKIRHKANERSSSRVASSPVSSLSERSQDSSDNHSESEIYDENFITHQK